MTRYDSVYLCGEKVRREAQHESPPGSNYGLMNPRTNHPKIVSAPQGAYGNLAQWWSKRLLTVRMGVRVPRFPPSPFGRLPTICENVHIARRF